MELLIIIAVILVIGFVVHVFDKYREGREAVIDLRRTRSELFTARRQIKKVKELSETLKKTCSQLQKTSNEYDALKKNNNENVELIKSLQEGMEEKDSLYKTLHSSDNNTFTKISSLMSDFLTLQYDISAHYLKTKKHPAHVEAERIKELKQQTKEIIYKAKISQYKYEYLFTLFPDLEMYVDSTEEMEALNQFDNLGDFQDNTDRTRKYLSKEEYKSLPEDERNQLALDRYIENQKSKWEIGRDYELYIGYVYSSEGWDVEYFGIDKQLNDMGRDLIAKKDGVVHIIQCKYWAQRKMIHEKHIAQLYGTTIQYKLASSTKNEVVPVFVTNITLSDTAKEFSDYLGVKYQENKDLEDFPRIKCNVNHGEYGETKIYHLPMDQQYDRTKIMNRGEFFAYTVK